MPKKQSPETPEEQSERFKHETQKLIDAGELSPTEAETAIESILARQKRGKAGRT